MLKRRSQIPKMWRNLDPVCSLSIRSTVVKNAHIMKMGSDPLFSIWMWHCDVSKIRTYDDYYKVWRTWDRCDAFKIAEKCSTCAHYNTIIIGDAEIEREKHLCPSYTNTSVCLNWEMNEDIDLPQ